MVKPRVLIGEHAPTGVSTVQNTIVVAVYEVVRLENPVGRMCVCCAAEERDVGDRIIRGIDCRFRAGNQIVADVIHFVGVSVATVIKIASAAG